MNIEGIPFVDAGTQIPEPEEPFGTHWWLFRAEDIKQDAIRNGYPEYTDEDLIHVLGLTRRYQGPGMPYESQGVVRRVGQRVLVTQRFGCDI